MNAMYKKYLYTQTAASLGINFVANGGIAYLTHKNSTSGLPKLYAGYLSLLFDIAVTALILAWLIGWAANAGLKKSGLYQTLNSQNRLQLHMARWFRIPARYGWLLCIGIIPLFYLLSVLGIVLFGITQFTVWGYVIYKAGYTGVMGALLIAIFIYSGMHRPSMSS
ncbi:MAG: hypothetical protein ACK5MN_04115 [Lachnospiraceae bacterium]